MGGKGSGRKKTAEPVTQPEVKGSQGVQRNSQTADSVPISHPPGIFADEERQAFMEAALDNHETEPPLDNAGEEPEEPQDEVAEALPEQEQEEIKEEIADTPPIEEPSEFKPEEKGEERKFDPEETINKGAFYEERDKRKEAQKEARELKGSVESLTAKLDALSQNYEKLSNQEDEFLTDEDKKFKAIREELDQLKKANSVRSEQDENNRVTSAKREQEVQINNVDEELEAEGFGGFKFMVPHMSDEITAMIAEDPDNVRYDNPEGWKKIYKEVIYPRISGMFVQQEKNKIFEKKTALKGKANLITSPGKDDKPPKKDDENEPLSYKDFTEMHSGFGGK